MNSHSRQTQVNPGGEERRRKRQATDLDQKLPRLSVHTHAEKEKDTALTGSAAHGSLYAHMRPP